MTLDFPHIQRVLTTQALSLSPAQELESPTREGRSWRWDVQRSGGQRALFYVFEDDAACARAAVVSSPRWSSELFAIPDGVCILRSERALVLEGVDGMTLPDYINHMGASALHALPSASVTLEQVGGLMRKLHSLAAPARRFGDVLEASASTTTFNGYVAARLEVVLEALQHHTPSGASRQALLEHVGGLRHELSAFHPRYPASLIHGSPRPENFWVNMQGEVVALTGFQDAAFLPPEVDTAYLIWMANLIEHDALLRAFYKGYGAARTMDVQRRGRFYRRLLALETLAGKRQRPPNVSTERLIWMASPAAV